jgi:hypothetical protein
MYCRRHITITVLFVFFLAVSLHAGDQKKQQQIYVKADQTADLQPAKMVAAKQKCENWALAAGLETLFQREGVSLDQNYWVTRLSGAEVCHQELPDLDTVANAVNQDFVQPDGQHVRLEVGVVSGPPTNADAMIAGIKRQQLSLLLWRGHPYYLTGVTYDEHAAANGFRMFLIKELRLSDTYAQQPAVVFQKGRDDASQMNGFMTVSVIPQ